MKFKIVEPKKRINSKDLWEGEHLNGDLINFSHNEPGINDFPIKITDYYQGQVIGDWLKKYGYNLDLSSSPFNVGKGKFIPFIINSDGDKNITLNNTLDEIKVNNPNPNPTEVLSLFGRRKYKGDSIR